jgi:ferrous iron transport protein A
MWAQASELALPDVDNLIADAPRVSLANLRKGQSAQVLEVRLPRTDHGHDVNLVLRLLEIGFVPGERVRVVALGPGGNEPIAVRIGGTMFALRRHEAEHILVQAL